MKQSISIVLLGALLFALGLGAGYYFASPVNNDGAPDGPRNISWEEAREYIADCEVTSISQTHSLELYMTLKSGEEVKAIEPQIDQVFAEVVAAKEDGCDTDVHLITE